MIFVSVLELYNVRCLRINVSLIVIIFLDILHFWLQLSNVNTSCSDISLQIISKSGQVVIGILCLAKNVPKLLILSSLKLPLPFLIGLKLVNLLLLSLMLLLLCIHGFLIFLGLNLMNSYRCC